jgi:hypothetical protein
LYAGALIMPRMSNKINRVLCQNIIIFAFLAALAVFRDFADVEFMLNDLLYT